MKSYYCNPVVSIVIPTFNCISTIEHCLKSVISQSLTRKEIIVVDGGSTDGTLHVINKYKNNIDYIISEQDDGLYDAINKGILATRGEWIYILGADDSLYDRNVLLRVFSTQRDDLMIYGNVIISGDGIVGNEGSIYDGRFSIFKLSEKNICQQAIFYRRVLFEYVGMFDKKYNMLADWVFNMKTYSFSHRSITYIDSIIAIYCATGRSGNIPDEQFEREHLGIIRKYLGFLPYLRLLLLRLWKKISDLIRKELSLFKR